MKINFQVPPKHLDEKMVYNILKDYKMLNCEVLVRDENATVDDCKNDLPCKFMFHYRNLQTVLVLQYVLKAY